MTTPPLPETIGRYRILDEIGRGAMGRVYRAHDPHTDRTVALKVLDVEHGRTAEQAAQAHIRFLREARAAGRLSHPGIVAVYDADLDTASGSPFLAMELVTGRSLAEVLGERGLLPWSEAVAIAAAVAEALDHAHSRGVVHRDLKPANVLLADSGAVKVSDFGVAMLVDDSSTLTGMLRGTPSYMAPEQIRGDAVDGRSDLYSLGAVLYEMLTGEAPFQAESLVGVAHQAVHDEPRPPSFACPDLPLDLERVVLRAMAKRPDARYASGRELAAALRVSAEPTAPPPFTELAAPPPVAEPTTPPPAAEPPTVVMPRVAAVTATAPPLSPRPRARTALAVAALAAALAGALAVVLWLGRAQDSPDGSAGLSPDSTHRPLTTAAPATPPVTAPDGAAARTEAEEPAENRPPAVVAPDEPPPVAPIESEAAPPTSEAVPAKPPAPPAAARASPVAPPDSAGVQPTAPPETAPVEVPELPVAAPTATIELHFIHRIKAGELEVWIDGEPAWSTPLESPRNPLRRIGGEELIGFIDVPAGRREIEVRVTNAAESIDARAAVSAELATGGTHVLRAALQPLRSRLRLEWEP
jgi:eukaryotic-like serine/threonine-protein kinase